MMADTAAVSAVPKMTSNLTLPCLSKLYSVYSSPFPDRLTTFWSTLSFHLRFGLFDDLLSGGDHVKVYLACRFHPQESTEYVYDNQQESNTTVLFREIRYVGKIGLKLLVWTGYFHSCSLK
ncbi:uncharacterized protein LOC117327262 [Pecten maximus]|uniref:uncharacterized protein LOC117327262 n=1 Tax=Pecten maximus TaxID=6579 RepID=UPI0014588BD3|nr:uncharacterized protein LOC117327262 [Pecten maximus]